MITYCYGNVMFCKKLCEEPLSSNNSVSFKKKVSIVEQALPAACTCHADSMTVCF